MNTRQKQLISTYFPEMAGAVQSSNDPALTSLIIALIGKIESVKGEKGDTPQKGVDYWTDAEINQVIEYIRKMVVTKDILEAATPIKGVHYKDGEDGSDYILTSKDKKEIASQIDVPIVEKIIEKTEVIKEISVSEIDVSKVKGAVSKKDLEINNRSVLDGMQRIQGRIKLIDQRWGAHGGGLNKVSTDNTLTGLGTPASPLSVVGGAGAAPYQEVLTYTDGTTYTLSHVPTSYAMLFLNGQFIVATTYYTRTGATITMITPNLSTDELTTFYV